MPTPTKGPRLGGGPAHERLMLANLTTALFVNGRITTTAAKAKRVRPLAERMITFAKRGDLASRRRVMTVIRDKGAVHELFTQIGPRFANRPGGYTRIVKLEPRKGDAAPMAVIELVEALEESTTKKRSTKKAAPAPKATKKAAATRQPVTEEAEAQEPAAEEPQAAAKVAEETQAEQTVAEESSTGEGEPAEAPADEAGADQGDDGAGGDDVDEDKDA